VYDERQMENVERETERERENSSELNQQHMF
jgi:hypothetical protein